MPKQYSTKPESFGEVTSALQKAGFKILLVFSLLILAVIVIAQPQNVYVAVFFGLSWCAISVAGIIFSNYGWDSSLFIFYFLFKLFFYIIRI